MTIISQLSCSLHQRGEEANIELAKKIVKTNDKNAVKELVEHLSDKNKAVQHDCIKVLYEIGELNPELISDYFSKFIELLPSKDNRMQWGAMTALNTLVKTKPADIYKSIPVLVATVEAGSVITRDNYVSILAKLYALKPYTKHVFPLLIEQLQNCPSNQLPMYAENILTAIVDEHKTALVTILSLRLDDFEKESKKKRVEKVIKKLQIK